MPRVLMGVVLVVSIVAVAACGGGGGAPTDGPPGSGAAPVTNGEVPAGSTVGFGTAYDPTTFALADKSTKAKVGAPIVAVGRALAPVDGTGVQIEIKLNGVAKPKRAPDAIDHPAAATFFASDLTGDALTPGTWIVSYVSPTGRVIASGFLSVSP